MYEGSLAGDRVSAYRWHVADPIRFSKSLKFSIEHRGSVVEDNGKKLSGSNERADWVSSVAYWYQTPIDHQQAGPVLDLWSKGGDWREFVLGIFKLEKGHHLFKLQGRGSSVLKKPSVPEKYAVGISSLSLLRLESL